MIIASQPIIQCVIVQTMFQSSTRDYKKITWQTKITELKRNDRDAIIELFSEYRDFNIKVTSLMKRQAMLLQDKPQGLLTVLLRMELI